MTLIREIYHLLTLADKILIAVLAALSVASLFLVGLAAQPGATALIAVAGQPAIRKSLQHDDLFILEGAAGRALIEISDASIHIRDSDCPQKLCVRQGRIRRVGEIIVCVPNKITIWIEGRRPHPFDAVTG
jgi:hypothetical protein